MPEAGQPHVAAAESGGTKLTSWRDRLLRVHPDLERAPYGVAERARFTIAVSLASGGAGGLVLGLEALRNRSLTQVLVTVLVLAGFYGAAVLVRVRPWLTRAAHLHVATAFFGVVAIGPMTLWYVFPYLAFVAAILASPLAGIGWALLGVLQHVAVVLAAGQGVLYAGTFGLELPLAPSFSASLFMLGYAVIVCLAGVLISRIMASAFAASEAANRELTAALAVAQQANAARSLFVAHMSHELRTPMTAVLGYASLLQDADLAPPLRIDYATVIRRNGEHLLSVLNSVLDYAKMEAGRVTIESSTFDPCQLAREVVQLMRARAEEKGVRLEIALAPRVPRTVRSDATKVRQILTNLVSNAVKFTEYGGVTVRVACDERDGRAILLLSVEDTGVGVQPEEIERLFRPFEQADASTTRRHGGTGLGLAISRQFAELLGGAIVANSQPGVGSEFMFELDLGLWSTVALIEPVPTPQGPIAALDFEPSGVRDAAPLKGIRILLAEDGPDNQALLVTFLESVGAEVTIANDGAEAVERATKALKAGRAFDLVLMDMNMPELDGVGAVSTLRARGYTQPIVMLTANALPTDEVVSREAGASGFLIKPIDRAALTAAVLQHLLPPPIPSAVESAEFVRPSLHAHDPAMRVLLARFLVRLSEHADELDAALVWTDVERLRKTAHQLKGAAGGYGFPWLGEVAAEVDRLARLPGSDEAVAQAATRLIRACREAVRASASLELTDRQARQT